MAFLFVAYPKCSTCKAAQRFLEDHQMDYALRDITRDVPTAAELDAWQQKSGLPLRAFFNTSGLRYRALGLKDSLADMPRQAQLALLASDGMLI